MICDACGRARRDAFTPGHVLADPAGLAVCAGGGECVTYRLRREQRLVEAARAVRAAAASEMLPVDLHNAIAGLAAAEDGL